MKVEKSSYLRVIHWYTNFSESLMTKIVEKFGAAIIIVSILRKIFGSNRPLPMGWEENGTPQACRPWVCRVCLGTPRFWQIS